MGKKQELEDLVEELICVSIN